MKENLIILIVVFILTESAYAQIYGNENQSAGGHTLRWKGKHLPTSQAFSPTTSRPLRSQSGSSKPGKRDFFFYGNHEI